MGKPKVQVAPENRRTSPRLAQRAKPALGEKKKIAAKKAPKAKKTKGAENGNTKAEDPKPEATEAN